MYAHAYSEDLAYVHDAGFTAFVRGAAPGILRLFRQQGIRGGFVVEVGCGTGVLAARLVEAGYRVLGIDVSPSMLRIARVRAPGAAFRAGSFHSARLPACDAVLSVGECVNYGFDASPSVARLKGFFRRAHRALRPGGVLVFDFLEPLDGGSRAGGTHRVGKDWAVLVERTEDRRRHTLVRRITTFRCVGSRYRRTNETHLLRLLPRRQVVTALRQAGFSVRVRRGYGAMRLEPGHLVVVGRRAEG